MRWRAPRARLVKGLFGRRCVSAAQMSPLRLLLPGWSCGGKSGSHGMHEGCHELGDRNCVLRAIVISCVVLMGRTLRIRGHNDRFQNML